MQQGYNPSFVDSPFLAMGASDFSNHPGQSDLPTVEQELAFLETFHEANSFLNEDFTSEILQKERSRIPYEIIHLSTHAELVSSTEAYVYFWDEVLTLEELEALEWHNNRPVELLVLSACETALENDREEFGIAGLTVRAGVRSAAASLWTVDAKATFALMTQFYENLHFDRTEDGRTMTKAEALRQAQIAMLRGEVRFEGGQVVWQNTNGDDVAIALEFPGDKALGDFSMDLSDPQHWAGFTMVGSPW